MAVQGYPKSWPNSELFGTAAAGHTETGYLPVIQGTFMALKEIFLTFYGKPLVTSQ